MKLPNSLEALIVRLAELPSIGPRQATRLAFHLLAQGTQRLRLLAENIDELGTLKLCARCFFPTTQSEPRPSEGVGAARQNLGGLCPVCADPKRDQKIIMIVEKETDLITVERTGKFSGRYLIIGPIGKIGILEEWQKLRLAALKATIERDLGPSTGSGQAGQAPQSSAAGQAEEIILGFNPTSHGDWHAETLAKELAPLAKKMTRLGRGLPTGGEIEFADDDTLGAALERRS